MESALFRGNFFVRGKIFIFAHTARMDQSKAKRGKRSETLLAVVFLFFVFSFFGWCMEKVTFLILFGENADRGFLRLPFCTIYGGSLAVIRLVLGVPMKKERPYPLNMLFLIEYAVGAALLATATELAVGILFDKYLGMRLWLYTGYPHHYKGYICLPMSVAWGGMITLAMAALWMPLERLLKKVPAAVLGTIDTVLIVLITVDFVACLMSVL